MRFMIIPGINGSDADHWQTRWQADWGSSAVRIAPSSWDDPDLDDWCRAIDQAVAAQPTGTVLVAHSLGCLAVAHRVTLHRRGVAGVFLVATPDAAGPNFPAAAPTFTRLVTGPLGVPGLMVTSDNDPYSAGIGDG